MSTPPRPVAGGPGLAAARLGQGPDTLQTLVHDHVALRTPTRPDHGPGNALHLFAPPRSTEDALARFDRSVGQLPGVRRRTVAWEVADVQAPAGVDAGGGARLASHVVGVLGSDRVPEAPRVPEGVELVRASTPEHWAGAKVLYLQTDWQGTERYWRWRVDQQRQLTDSGGGMVLVAYRFGVPVGRAGLFVPHDASVGVGDRLAGVEDVVVHPLYRRGGIGTALVLALVDPERFS